MRNLSKGTQLMVQVLYVDSGGPKFKQEVHYLGGGGGGGDWKVKVWVRAASKTCKRDKKTQGRERMWQ